jgi:hypothetical protein
VWFLKWLFAGHGDHLIHATGGDVDDSARLAELCLSLAFATFRERVEESIVSVSVIDGAYFLPGGYLCTLHFILYDAFYASFSAGGGQVVLKGNLEQVAVTPIYANGH